LVRPAPASASRWKRGCSFFLGALWLAATYPAFIVAPLGLMAFDSGESPTAYTLTGAFYALPAMTLIASICGFVGGATGRWHVALLGAVAPFLPVLLAIGILILNTNFNELVVS